MELVKPFYDALSNEEKDKFLQTRSRPRKPDKKVKMSVKPKPNDN
jgi:hypothetical protein